MDEVVTSISPAEAAREAPSLRLRAGRLLEITGISPARSGTRRLLEWISSRPEVARVQRDAARGRLEIHLHGTRATVFLAGLRDRLHALGEAQSAVPAVRIRSAVPGRVRLDVTGASPAARVGLASWLARQPGVYEATASAATASVLVLFDPDVTDAQRLAGAARERIAAGAAVEAIEPSQPASSPRSLVPALPPTASVSDALTRARPYLALAFDSAVLAVSVAEALPAPVLLPAVALTAIPTLRRTVEAFREGRATVDSLDTAAVVSALVTGQVATAAFMTWLLGLGDLLLSHTQERARKALSSLVQLDTAEAHRVEGDRVTCVSVADLRVGDRIVVAAGQRVPADAEVESGSGDVDEKALTGESLPRARQPGERLLAATVVVDGELVARVTRTGTETTAARIVQMLEEAGSRPMGLQRRVERSADRLVWPTIATAVASAALSGDVTRLTSVLINDFGTGIRIAVPTNALTAITLASRSGVLIKGAAYLELLARADVIVFDKTGTLTAGEPEVVDVTTLGLLPERSLLSLAAAAESRQAHPLAAAVRRRAAAAGIAVIGAVPGGARHVVGRGVSARVGGREVLVGSARWLSESDVSTSAAVSVIARHRQAGISTLLVAVDGALVGALGYADEPRPESAEVVAALKSGGRRRTVLLSGDAPEPVQAVARAVGVDEARGELLPADKLAYVKAQQQAGRIVAMVGDGINDAPALAAADVGISLHGSTDVALEAADVILLEGGLRRLQIAFEAGETAMSRVRRGVGIVVAPNAAAIVAGALGLINPAIATVANNGSTLVAAVVGVAPLFGRERP